MAMVSEFLKQAWFMENQEQECIVSIIIFMCILKYILKWFKGIGHQKSFMWVYVGGRKTNGKTLEPNFIAVYNLI